MQYLNQIEQSIQDTTAHPRVIILEGITLDQIPQIADQIKSRASAASKVHERPINPPNRDFFPEFNRMMYPESPQKNLFIVLEKIHREEDWQADDNSLLSLIRAGQDKRLSGTRLSIVNMAKGGATLSILAEDPKYFSKFSSYFPDDTLSSIVSVHHFPTINEQ